MDVDTINMNTRTVIDRAFEWGNHPKQIAQWQVPDDNLPIDQATLVPHEAFVEWAKNLKGKYGFKMKDYSRFLIWFDDKDDAIAFLKAY